MGEDAQKFLDALRTACPMRMQTLTAGSLVYRAQIGYNEDVYEDDGMLFINYRPFPPERMKPLQGKASEGRANPRGIAYLYLASDKDTAISEVRPWVGAILSVGIFHLPRDLMIVDFSSDNTRGITAATPDPSRWDKLVFRAIGRAFSHPVAPTNDPIAYIPTQIVAELIKTAGYDGIGFSSSLDSGNCYCLFDLDDAMLQKCEIYEVKKVKFEAEEAGIPYYPDYSPLPV
jgi:hypothetical protein